MRDNLGVLGPHPLELAGLVVERTAEHVRAFLRGACGVGSLHGRHGRRPALLFDISTPGPVPIARAPVIVRGGGRERFALFAIGEVPSHLRQTALFVLEGRLEVVGSALRLAEDELSLLERVLDRLSRRARPGGAPRRRRLLLLLRRLVVGGGPAVGRGRSRLRAVRGVLLRCGQLRERILDGGDPTLHVGHRSLLLVGGSLQTLDVLVTLGEPLGELLALRSVKPVELRVHLVVLAKIGHHLVAGLVERRPEL